MAAHRHGQGHRRARHAGLGSAQPDGSLDRASSKFEPGIKDETARVLALALPPSCSRAPDARVQCNEMLRTIPREEPHRAGLRHACAHNLRAYGNEFPHRRSGRINSRAHSENVTSRDNIERVASHCVQAFTGVHASDETPHFSRSRKPENRRAPRTGAPLHRGPQCAKAHSPRTRGSVIVIDICWGKCKPRPIALTGRKPNSKTPADSVFM